MATKLEYLAFIGTFFAAVEHYLNALCWILYGVLRKRIPAVCCPVVGKLEIAVAAAYSTLRTWTCEAGKALLVAADQKVAAVVTWIARCFESCSGYERYKAVREFWVAIAARISDTWRDHGILVGTFVAVFGLLIAIREIMLGVLRGPRVQKFVDMVKTSAPVQNMKCYYDSNIQPLVTYFVAAIAAAVQKTGAALSGPMDSTRECLSSSVESIVGTVYYAKLYDGATTAVQHLKLTALYQKVAEKAEPYVGPTWERIRLSDFYANLVDTFTPIKEE